MQSDLTPADADGDGDFDHFSWLIYHFEIRDRPFAEQAYTRLLSPTAGGSPDYQIGDVTGDARPEIVFVEDHREVVPGRPYRPISDYALLRIFRITGDHVSSVPVHRDAAIVVGQFDSTPGDEIALNNGAILNPPDFGPVATFPAVRASRDFTKADLDGDGVDELLLLASGQLIAWDTQLEEPRWNTSYPQDPARSRVPILGDLTGDGLPELVFTNSTQEPPRYVVLDGLTGTPVESFATPPAVDDCSDLTILDVDQDGLSEIACLDLGRPWVFDIRSMSWMVEPMVSRAASVDLADLDGDGRIELLAWDEFKFRFAVADFGTGQLHELRARTHTLVPFQDQPGPSSPTWYEFEISDHHFFDLHRVGWPSIDARTTIARHLAEFDGYSAHPVEIELIRAGDLTGDGRNEIVVPCGEHHCDHGVAARIPGDRSDLWQLPIEGMNTSDIVDLHAVGASEVVVSNDDRILVAMGETGETIALHRLRGQQSFLGAVPFRGREHLAIHSGSTVGLYQLRAAGLVQTSTVTVPDRFTPVYTRRDRSGGKLWLARTGGGMGAYDLDGQEVTLFPDVLPDHGRVWKDGKVAFGTRTGLRVYDLP